MLDLDLCSISTRHQRLECVNPAYYYRVGGDVYVNVTKPTGSTCQCSMRTHIFIRYPHHRRRDHVRPRSRYLKIERGFARPVACGRGSVLICMHVRRVHRIMLSLLVVAFVPLLLSFFKLAMPGLCCFLHVTGFLVLAHVWCNYSCPAGNDNSSAYMHAGHALRKQGARYDAEFHSFGFDVLLWHGSTACIPTGFGAAAASYQRVHG